MKQYAMYRGDEFLDLGTAWELSRKLVDTALLKEYDKFNEINLASYRKKLQIKS